MQSLVAISAGVVLLISGAFSAFVWPTFFRRVANDPRAKDEAGKPTPFYKVHRLLVTIALTLAGLSLIAGVLVFVYLV